MVGVCVLCGMRKMELCFAGFLFGALRTDALDDVFGFFGDEAFGQRHRRNGDVAEAESLVAAGAGEVHVALAVAGVVVVADAVFLHSAAVVDVVQQVGVAEKGQRAEQGGAVDGGQRLLEVAQAEDAIGVVPYLSPYHQTHGGYAYAGIMQCFFVSNHNYNALMC